MKLAGRADAALGGVVVLASLATMLVSLTHSFEDFASGVPAHFRLTVLTAGVLLAVVYLVHSVALMLLAVRHRLGYLLTLVLGAFWFLASVLDHLGDVLLASNYRAGPPSKLWEVVLMLVSALLALLAWWGFRRSGTRGI